MSNWYDAVSSRARETFNQAEEGAHNAISKAKEAVTSVTRRAEPPPLPEPSKAMDEQFGADVTAMANAQLSTIPPNSPATPPIYNPVDLHKKSKELLAKSGELLRKIPEAIPGVKEYDSLAKDHHAQVMGEIGLVTSVVSGALGPPGAVAQLGIDAVVDSVGTKEDKYAYGAGQMVGAVVTGAAGLVGVGAGVAVEGGSGGAASEVAVPLAAAGAQTVVVAGSLAVGAGILMSRGSPPRGPEAPNEVAASRPIPNADKATIDPRKLDDYALNPDHPVGGNKAKVFESAFGFNRSNSDELMRQLKEGVTKTPAIPGKVDQYGQRFTVDIPVTGPKGSGVVRTGWILPPGSDTPQLTTLFVK